MQSACQNQDLLRKLECRRLKSVSKYLAEFFVSRKDMGSLTKCVPEIRGCVEKSVKLHISENCVAHRVPANFSIYAKKHHHYSVIYFLTDLEKMHPFESCATSKYVSATRDEFVFYGESNRK